MLIANCNSSLTLRYRVSNNVENSFDYFTFTILQKRVECTDYDVFLEKNEPRLLTNNKYISLAKI